MAALDVYVKGDPVAGVLGDCPFCHRVLITLEQKNVEHTRKYIDFANKPDWLAARSGGKVPVINSGEFWLPDSDAIVVYLEEQYPEPSMATTVPAEIGAKVFPAFLQFLKCSPEEAKDKEAALTAELKLIDDFLAAHGPFFGGATLNATDAAIAPKLHHADVVLKPFKGWEIPSDLPAVRKYLEALKEQPAWQKTLYSEDTMIKGWAAHFAAL